MPTDRSDNFERRLKETMDSELEPELVTPHTAGSEEIEEDFPIIKQFRDTLNPGTQGSNRRSRARSSQSQRGEDSD